MGCGNYTDNGLGRCKHESLHQSGADGGKLTQAAIVEIGGEGIFKQLTVKIGNLQRKKRENRT